MDQLLVISCYNIYDTMRICTDAVSRVDILSDPNRYYHSFLYSVFN